MRPTLLLLLVLAGCGALPQPFFGNPGATGTRLAEPPPSRLAVPTPSQSLLSDEGGEAWATATAAALANEALPASHAAVRPGDWTLALSADLRGSDVLPSYALIDSTGTPQGTAQGAPVPASSWSRNDPAVLKAAAEQAAPAIDTLLTRIQAARLHNDPNSLQNRPARVFVSGVSGAPGDGNRSLAAQIRLKLTGFGIVVQDTVEGADYKLRCEVRTAPGAGRTLRVELQWVVDDARGERGRVVQLNDLPAGSVEPYWGDVAVVAAEEAAGGIKDVLFNAAGPRVGDASATTQDAATKK
jgi:hypothetical protein